MEDNTIKRKRRPPLKFQDAVGRTFNYLTVIAEGPSRVTAGGKYQRRWTFRCVCGREKDIIPSSVIKGITKSCGCKRKQLCREAVDRYYLKEYVRPVEGRAYSRYKIDAKKHNRTFNLSRDEFDELVSSNCFYCGTPPFLNQGNKTKSIVKRLNGLDRVDSSRGYTLDNVVPCCIHCNKAKNTMSTNEFVEWICLIYNHFCKSKGRR